MTDPTDPRGMPGYDNAMNNFSMASKSLQSFASEMQRMAKESFDKTSELMEKLRGAKTMEEVMSVQTSFMQQSFAMSAEYTRRFSELMMTLPLEMARNARDAFQKGTDAMQQAGQDMRQAGDHHG